MINLRCRVIEICPVLSWLGVFPSKATSEFKNAKKANGIIVCQEHMLSWLKTSAYLRLFGPFELTPKPQLIYCIFVSTALELFFLGLPTWVHYSFICFRLRNIRQLLRSFSCAIGITNSSWEPIVLLHVLNQQKKKFDWFTRLEPTGYFAVKLCFLYAN